MHPVVIQTHVHSQLFLALVLAQQFVHVFLAIVDLDVLHGVCPEVFEKHFIVALHEILTVEKQALHKSSVDEDLSVRVQLYARQLADESVEHASFEENKCICIVKQSVALIVEFHFSGGDSHFI